MNLCCCRFRILFLLWLGCSACASRHAVRAGRPVALGWREQGIASWYGVPYHGRPTASGEIYDMRQRTAAHPSLPFGVIVRVTNLESGSITQVRINDRGPFIKKRIIDLSRLAAEDLGMVRQGTVRVRLEVIQLTPRVQREGPQGRNE